MPFFQHVAGSEHGIAVTSDVAIPFAADDDGTEISQGIAAAVNAGRSVNPGFSARAQQQLDIVSFKGVASAASVIINQPSPFNVLGEGIGGNITGMAFAAAPTVDARPDHLFAVCG